MSCGVSICGGSSQAVSEKKKGIEIAQTKANFFIVLLLYTAVF